MKLLIDMNLAPDWVEVFEQQGWQALHWSTVGDPRATDHIIMEWARNNGYSVFTHDLDFGALLAIARAQGPSVIQIRTQDIIPQSLGHRLVQILRQYESLLESGALITVDENKSRVHILPFQ
jgi:predicted nuclease of predicted toxin-antitoxin system